MYSGGPNQFTSSFWIERQWLLETEIDDYCIKYSICPYRKRWYEYSQDNSSVELSKSTRLLLTYIIGDDIESDDIKRSLTIAQIYHMEISQEKIFIGTLIQAIHLLSELDTLKIHSLLLDQPRYLCFEEMIIFCTTEDTSKITKVYLEEINDINDIHFLMGLCPYMTYLKSRSYQ